MKCFYHSADLDGHCSGSIVKHFHPNCEMIGINYGHEFPWDTIIPGETVFMVDFTLQPFDQMEKLASMCCLIWIDHHKTEIEEAHKRDFLQTCGIRLIGIGACALVWDWFTDTETETSRPVAIQLLAEYDVWDHSDPRVLPFQYGFRMFEDTRPTNTALWGKFFSESYQQNTAIDEVVTIGRTILDYEKSQNEKFCRAYAFPTELHVTDGEVYTGGVYRAIACNRGFTNSKVFDSVWNQAKYDLMLTFVRLKRPANKWTVSLYSDKPEVDCGQIARVFGGGGHKGAAGFQCVELPFEI